MAAIANGFWRTVAGFKSDIYGYVTISVKLHPALSSGGVLEYAVGDCNIQIEHERAGNYRQPFKGDYNLNPNLEMAFEYAVLTVIFNDTTLNREALSKFEDPDNSLDDLFQSFIPELITNFDVRGMGV